MSVIQQSEFEHLGQARQAAASHPVAPLRLTVLFDLICPWSWLGMHRTVRSLTARRRPWSIDWQPFLLHPDMPRGGICAREYERQRYGGPERARRLERAVTAMGAADGLRFAFQRIERVPPTILPHRLIGWAAEQSLSPDRLAGLVLAVQAAHFERGEDISLPGTLAAIAQAHGLDADAVREVLRDRRAAHEWVVARNRANLAYGGNGIPCLMAEDGLALAGAQDGVAIERFLDVLFTAPVVMRVADPLDIPALTR